MDFIIGTLEESYFLLNKMSFYLILGFVFAGIVHIFLEEGMIAKHLGKNNFVSVIKASLFGIPLPLCSCGVIPAALSLKKEGASKGAVLSFLISTPTTGVDSILATYGLLGPVFAVYRVIASFVTGVSAGLVANIFFKRDASLDKPGEGRPSNACCHHHDSAKDHDFVSKIKGAFRYAFVDLLKDTGAWILLGILIGGFISYIVPDSFIARFLGSGWQSMFIMLLIGIPMYVCSAGSLPIATALILKGMNPGAAFVFLLCGPATNSAGLTVIARELGAKAAAIFLGTIIVCSISLGILLNHIWQFLNIDITSHLMRNSEIIPPWLEIVSSIILLFGIAGNIVLKKK